MGEKGMRGLDYREGTQLPVPIRGSGWWWGRGDFRLIPGGGPIPIRGSGWWGRGRGNFRLIPGGGPLAASVGATQKRALAKTWHLTDFELTDAFLFPANTVPRSR